MPNEITQSLRLFTRCVHVEGGKGLGINQDRIELFPLFSPRIGWLFCPQSFKARGQDDQPGEQRHLKWSLGQQYLFLIITV